MTGILDSVNQRTQLVPKPIGATYFPIDGSTALRH